jgi:hypothetical protein
VVRDEQIDAGVLTRNPNIETGPVILDVGGKQVFAGVNGKQRIDEAPSFTRDGCSWPLDPAAPQQGPVLGGEDQFIFIRSGNEPKLRVNRVRFRKSLFRYVMYGFIACDEPHFTFINRREPSDEEVVHTARLAAQSFSQLKV